MQDSGPRNVPSESIGQALRNIVRYKRQFVIRHPALNTRTSVYRKAHLKHAAVLIPLFILAKDLDQGRNFELNVLLTKRSPKLSSHAGEVCFPGGRREEDDDVDDVDTAKRECAEETGLPMDHVHMLAELEPTISKHGTIVIPIVALVCPPEKIQCNNSLERYLLTSIRTRKKDNIDIDHAICSGDYAPAYADKAEALSYLKANTDEVSDMFISRLHLFVEKPPSYRFRDISWQGISAFRMHYFSDQNFTIWGLTAHILIHVASIAFCPEPLPFEYVAPSSPNFITFAKNYYEARVKELEDDYRKGKYAGSKPKGKI